MNIPIAIKIECAKGEIMNALESIQRQYSLPPCIIEGVLSSVQSEVRAEAKLELINATNAMLREKNEELEEAKKAAKKVLEPETDEQEQPEGQQEQPETDEQEQPDE